MGIAALNPSYALQDTHEGHARFQRGDGVSTVAGDAAHASGATLGIVQELLTLFVLFQRFDVGADGREVRRLFGGELTLFCFSLGDDGAGLSGTGSLALPDFLQSHGRYSGVEGSIPEKQIIHAP